MLKFVLLCLSYVILANALECYITDLEAVRKSLLTAGPKIENCRKYFTKLGVIMDPTDDHLFRCSIQKLEADDVLFNVQTCVVSSNTCDELKGDVHDIQRALQMDFTNVTCTICDTDLCNKGMERSIQMKNQPLPVRTIVMICSGVVLFITFVVIIVVKRRRRTQTRTRNVFV